MLYFKDPEKNEYYTFPKVPLFLEGKVMFFSDSKEMEADRLQNLPDEQKIANALKYLKETDWYYARKQEVGKEPPQDVVEKRIVCRELIDMLGM